ncbi:High Incidence of Males (increased X chromosome loss) [Caenorhabditis elegans]|nr:High Incidence of Males (increased X chromosome loss) [Caenorhabditis elegans]CBW48354.1 High Incidence of Males (increased X chromosome loss) [Caenorhabditis elegans]|eukprot:NP_001256556.1 High Incidence of Males (increased X chromosome loss) [Caenorhabditis elegans]
MCGRPPTKHRDTEQSQEITGSKKQKIFPTPHEKPAWWSFRIPKKRAQ